MVLVVKMGTTMRSGAYPPTTETKSRTSLFMGATGMVREPVARSTISGDSCPVSTFSTSKENMYATYFFTSCPGHTWNTWFRV